MQVVLCETPILPLNKLETLLNKINTVQPKVNQAIALLQPKENNSELVQAKNVYKTL